MPKAFEEDPEEWQPTRRALRIDENQVSLPVLISGVLIFLSTAFQIGYFQEIGIEFFSLTGPSDWLFGISLMIIPYVFLEPLVQGTYRYVRERIDQGTYYTSWIFMIVRVVTMTPAVVLFPIATLILVYGGQNSYFVYRFAIFVGVLLITSSILVELLAEYEIKGEAEASTLFRLAVMAGVLFLIAGQIYGRFIAGQTCTVVSSDGRFDRGTYLRSGSEGHLMRMAPQKVVFFPKDKVTQLFCGTAR